MKRFRYPFATAALLLLGIFSTNISFAQPSNDNCSGAITLTSGNTCSSSTYNLWKATSSSFAGACGGATSTTTYDVWFTFQAVNSTTTITLSNLGAKFASNTPYVEVLSGSSCSGFAIVGTCKNAITTPRFTVTGLTVGTFYYIRMYVVSSPTATPSSKWNFGICVQHQPVNDECTSAISLTPGATCSNTTGTLDLATANAATPIGCFAAGTYYDVWYKFTATGTTHGISLGNLGNNVSGSAQVQLYTGTCGSLSSVAGSCSATGTPSVVVGGLTGGAVYYVRVSTTFNPTGSTSSSGNGFSICITNGAAPPANDNCSGAISLTSSTSCNPISGTLLTSTATAGLTACGSIDQTSADVWYTFVAQSAYPSITLTESFPIGGIKAWLQIFSNTCGALNSLGCSMSSLNTQTIVGGSGLIVGNTYYIRVTTNKATGVPAGAGWGFTICVQDPSVGASVDYGKSYINVTKGGNGGTIDPGDILEIRATLVVAGSNKSIDSVAYYDTLMNSKGFALVPGSICLRTNEGKVYSQFTDAYDSDAGWRLPSGSDTVIQMNMGIGSNNVARGKINNTSRPSNFGSTCIVMATYRVVVYAPYDTKINYGGGRFSYRDVSTGITSNINFAQDSVVVYKSPGLCPNSVAPSNIISDEYSGTFGSATSRNRGTSPNTNYIYAPFGPPTNGGGPNDYYYGVANNTSGVTPPVTNTLLAKPNSNRVFNLWDITGDHTGASNTSKGNPPCDVSQPISASNPCGYMLVVNSAYNTDTAFQYNVTGLCPNTYYEISAWFKNICYKCGCDSIGNPSTTATGAGLLGTSYIPTAPGDSSGVNPNIAFDIDGVDYYTTGNLQYLGLGQFQVDNDATKFQARSDSTNKWVQRGFTYKTGSSQTSFVLTLRNNAPGGGGNDWAIDDIALKTCSPDVTVTPGPNPFVCDSNTIDIGATISSYFNTYTYYTWEYSIDNGATWLSTGKSGGPTTPIYSGGAWTYSVTYPTFIAYHDSLYRVMVASTTDNLSNASCRFSGGATIALTVDPCDFLLNVGILSFKGKNENNKGALYWTTSKETEPVKYEIQKSKDGSRFVKIGEITGYKDPSAETNRYTYVDPELLDNTLSWYRIKAINTQDNKFRYSKVVQLIGDKAGLQIESLINPFNSCVKFDLISGDDGLVEVEILDQYQHRLSHGSYNLVKGRNRINIDNTDNLPAGFYILRVTSNNNVINRKIIKRG